MTNPGAARFPIFKMLSAVVGWVALAILLTLLLAGCAPVAYPNYLCVPIQTERDPAMLCGPLKGTP